jgi:adenylosuccinate synthase
VRPVFEELPGWQTDISELREGPDLPPKARDYLAVLERQVGVPVRYVGTGPGRDQFVQLH